MDDKEVHNAQVVNDVAVSYSEIEKSEQILQIRKQKLIEAAIMSDDPEEIIKGQAMMQKYTGSQSKDDGRKSMLIDTQSYFSFNGFREKPTPMSYDVLRAMARTSVVNSVIRTRINQVAAFATPQRDKYSIGYEIRKKNYFNTDLPAKPTKEEQREILEMIEFLENGGSEDLFEGDDFGDFIRKTIRDSLTFDQMTFEVVRTRGKKVHEFFATDGSTYRVADNESNSHGNQREKRKEINGYLPSHVQIHQNAVIEEFYPWELCFGVRNPHSDIRLYGYGVSELEELMTTITSILWGEDYNRRFFKQGSAPKGILKVSGNVGEEKLREFKQQWNATMRGVQNAWKTPILEADKMEWINLQGTNRDMEFTKWIEFLIKITCAVFLIDPSEINFPFNGSPNEQYLFKGDNEGRVQYSRDKGLAPLLKFMQKKINKYVISQINPKYEFSFKGMDATNPEKEVELDNKTIRMFETINEVRTRRGKEPIDGGDIILDGTFLQKMMMDEQNKQGGGGEGEEEGNEEGNEEENPIKAAISDKENPITKGLNQYLDEFIKG